MGERLIKVISTLRQRIEGRRQPGTSSLEAQRAYVEKINRAYAKAGVEPYGGQLVPEGRRDLARALMD